ncbi:hypothetical protein Cob_v002655 [Colletotrichum orbiculare MAFF 240422]|uniref:Uncharacterized protein n=1 Tax=Colletotrichum orbiculare (strain 104-T / ATCC 96160 / CBS 514.97 / LARS 414 / MAFF 240422) TaxID=1213857 RepID=A0A484G284_COLOR|nr:hypothetical protein Cob_v002655 [Colletotrichum orbiculare MAFF 240422]
MVFLLQWSRRCPFSNLIDRLGFPDKPSGTLPRAALRYSNAHLCCIRQQTPPSTSSSEGSAAGLSIIYLCNTVTEENPQKEGIPVGSSNCTGRLTKIRFL